MDGLFGLLVIILLKVSGVSCEGEYCYDTTARRMQWCGHGCCETPSGTGDNCCSELDVHTLLFIVGGLATFGVAGIVVFVCWYKQYMARRRAMQVAAAQQASVPAGEGNNGNQLSNNYGFQPSVPPPAYPGPGVLQNSTMTSNPIYPPSAGSVYPPSAGPVYPPPPPQPPKFRRF